MRLSASEPVGSDVADLWAGPLTSSKLVAGLKRRQACGVFRDVEVDRLIGDARFSHENPGHAPTIWQDGFSSASGTPMATSLLF